MNKFHFQLVYYTLRCFSCDITRYDVLVVTRYNVLVVTSYDVLVVILHVTMHEVENLAVR